jgi:hypothetical protein
MTLQGAAPQPAAGLRPVGVAIAHDNGALFLHAATDAGVNETSQHVEIVHLNWSVETRFLIRCARLPIWRCQTFANGDILAYFGQHPTSTNIFDSSGVFLREIELGDYIEDIQVDGEGRIWVSYFDQKGYGKPALACFDAEGRELARFAEDVLDAYALNVGAHSTFMYGYTNFDLMEVGPNFSATLKPTPIRGASAMAQGRHATLFSHQYNEQPCMAHLLRYDLEDRPQHEVIELRRPDGAKLKEPAILGRQNLLHCFEDGFWFCIDVNTLAAGR